MPTYDYACEKCGHRFEAFHGINDPVLKKCPACSKLALKRLIGTGGGLIFKGSGFYITDYRSKSYTDAASKDSGGASAKGDAASSADGAKPDAAPKASGNESSGSSASPGSSKSPKKARAPGPKKG